MCITSKDWAGIWREWPRSSLLLSLPGDFMNPLHQLLECSSLGVAVLSRISANLPTYSPIVFRLNGHPSLKPGQFPVIPFVSSTRDLYGHTSLPKAGHFLTISSTVKEYGHRRFKCKVKLETKIFTGNCTQQLK